MLSLSFFREFFDPDRETLDRCTLLLLLNLQARSATLSARVLQVLELLRPCWKVAHHHGVDASEYCPPEFGANDGCSVCGSHDGCSVCLLQIFTYTVFSPNGQQTLRMYQHPDVSISQELPSGLAVPEICGKREVHLVGRVLNACAVCQGRSTLVCFPLRGLRKVLNATFTGFWTRCIWPSPSLHYGTTWSNPLGIIWHSSKSPGAFFPSDLLSLILTLSCIRSLKVSRLSSFDTMNLLILSAPSESRHKSPSMYVHTTCSYLHVKL